MRRRDEDGVVGVVLTIVIVFALIAVIELTRTAIAAQQINTRVIDITGSVSSANQHLNSVPELDKTNELAAQILVAAKPLSGQAQQIIEAATSINGSVQAIQGNAASINSTVHSIGGAVATIGSSVHTIGGTFTTLTPVVANIQQNIVAINQRVDVILGAVEGIKGDTGNITALVGAPSQLGTIAGQAQGILNITNSGGLCVVLGHLGCH